MTVSKLKKYQGIIYINDNVSEQLYRSLKKKFGKEENIDKLILIDNGNVSKHKKLHGVFEEVFFYSRFRKNKIVDYTFQEQPKVQMKLLKRGDEEI